MRGAKGYNLAPQRIAMPNQPLIRQVQDKKKLQSGSLRNRHAQS